MANLSVDDLSYEDDLKRHPASLAHWTSYLHAKRHAPTATRNNLAERALQRLPASYKLWKYYLADRRAQLARAPPHDPRHQRLIDTYERALAYLNKMPRIWIDYLTLLSRSHQLTRTRHAYDRALRALPVTQHERIWPLYLDFVKRGPVIETAVRVYTRYLQFEPEAIEDYIEFLLSSGRIAEAAQQLADVLNREHFVSQRGKTRHDLWMELCQLCTKNPASVRRLRVEAIIRSGLRTFSDEASHLWCALADYFIRQGLFEQARDVYEEGILSVGTVRDFSIIFDAYSQFEELLVKSQIEGAEAAAAADATPAPEAQLALDMQLARLERLLDRRPELLSSVLLRQNPHAVHEWLKRAQIFEGQPARVIETYATAVKTVDPRRALGKPHTLWLAFAAHYEAHDDLRNARVVLRKATEVAYKTVNDLAAVWMGWAELELRHKKYTEALAVLAEATAVPRARERARAAAEDAPVQLRLHRHTQLWCFFADLQESIHGFDAARAAYEKMFELRIVTPQSVLTFVSLLEERNHFELSFQAFERGLALFHYPHAMELWLPYLTKFVARYGGSKLERARDLFEQALDGCPAESSYEIFVRYARFEEEFGLARNALSVYDRAAASVEPERRLDVYEAYLAKAAEFFGVAKTRDIYEQAIDALPAAHLATMCERYASLELRLGEMDRARAIFAHGAQEVDPAASTGQEPPYWRAWHDFEVAHGNEDTFRDMLQLKRTVANRFATTRAFTATAAAAEKRSRDQDGLADDSLAERAKRRAITGASADFMPASAFEGARIGYAFKLGPRGLGYYAEYAASGSMALPAEGAQNEVEVAIVNEEIDIDDDDDDDDNDPVAGGSGHEMHISQKKVPDAVFGVAALPGGGGEVSPLETGMGALDRFRKASAK